MATIPFTQPTSDAFSRAEPPRPPGWVADLLGLEPDFFTRSISPRPGLQLLSRERSDVTLVSVRIPDAKSMNRPDFEGAVTQCYREVFKSLAGRPSPYPVRFWNHIPGLHDPMGPGLDRYMAFNAGRFRGMVAHYGNTDEVRRFLATASGTGHQGHDLVIHCLAAAAPGKPIENPRQVPAYLYSRRFGPIPPCFSRASLASIGGSSLMLVAGTASIRGEETVHIGDLQGQLRETFLNLGILIRAGAGEPALTGPDAAAPVAKPASMEEMAPWLGHLIDVRIYHTRPIDEVTIRSAAATAFPRLGAVEIIRADLCRPELLVEIEGTASFEHA